MAHAEQYIIYPKNIGPYLTIDETALSNGELYTVITNKERKELYPDVGKANKLANDHCEIQSWKIQPDIARTRVAHWFNDIEKAGFNAFMTIKRTFETHNRTITNYFYSRSTNAAAESFNAKIKDFRRQFRGVVEGV